jgi:tRNA pseudouridine55 synthase
MFNPESNPAPVRGYGGETAVPQSGILVVDKPGGITSFDAASRVKRSLRAKKTGHCGTLDPFATGVLIVCIDEATRIADQFLHMDKVYRFTARFGVETDTLDRTGQVTRRCEVEAPAESSVLEIAKEFVGTQLQKVPRFAAVRVGGQRLYDLSRRGIEVETPEREVHIRSLDLCEWTWPTAVFEACCSKGTYVRQLASHIGERLGCGAHVEELRRLAVGPYHVDRAISLEAVGAAHGDPRDPKGEGTIPMAEALTHLPGVLIQDVRVLSQLANGRLDPDFESMLRLRFRAQEGAVRLMAGEKRLAALWWPQPPDQGRRLRVFSW